MTADQSKWIRIAKKVKDLTKPQEDYSRATERVDMVNFGCKQPLRRLHLAEKLKLFPCSFIELEKEVWLN